MQELYNTIDFCPSAVIVHNNTAHLRAGQLENNNKLFVVFRCVCCYFLDLTQILSDNDQLPCSTENYPASNELILNFSSLFLQ